ncbi:MAG: GH39 family glycosyl hydrolase [Pirellulales bacterium]
MHGGNNGPVNLGETVDLSAYHRELAIPLTRLHDSHWPNPDVVDIHAVFPNFAADPSRPASYDFRRTDDYIQPIVNVGSQIVYRLGESIEHTKRKYYVHPPADYEKWAAICIGIIRHYNEGWADGFHHRIRYWEIWNEPENRPQMWSGSDQDYYRLYAVASKAIKARFPDLMVGGPAVGYSGDLVGEDFKPTAFTAGFLAACKAQSAPLDFFSWHRYSDDPASFARQARGVRKLLDQYGFTKTESHLNEWNYLPNNDWSPMLAAGQGLPRERWYAEMGGPRGAAFVVTTLLGLEDSPVDAANFYAAEVQGFGLFSIHGVPKKTFYAMKAFKLLTDTPARVAAEGGQSSGMAIAAGLNRDKTELRVLVSNYKSAGGSVKLTVKNVPWDSPTEWEMFIVDAQHDLERVRVGVFSGNGLTWSETMPAPSVYLIKLRKSQAP